MNMKKKIALAILGFALAIVSARLVVTSAAAGNTSQNIEQAAIKVPAPKELEKDVVTIQTKDGKQLVFHVELAKTSQERALGLMGRKFMAEDAGMLFVFDDVSSQTFWMKDTYIPLDILFIAHDGEIHHIHHNAKPQDLSKITAMRPALAVLELNGGITEKLGIEEGDMALNPVFHNTLYE